MIGTNEALGMTYPVYKAEVWRRLGAFWKERIGMDVHSQAYVAEKIEHCSNMEREMKQLAGVAKR